MSKNDEDPGVTESLSEHSSAAKKKAIPEALTVANGVTDLDVHEFVQQLMVSDKIILDYLKQSETKSGG